MSDTYLSKSERRKLKKEQKQKQAIRDRRSRSFRATGRIIAIVVGIVMIGGIAIYYISGRKVLPPIDMANHIEESPPSHIMDRPLNIQVFKHMLEHSDGEGPPGVIISYNCDDFACEDDLIEKLSAFVNENPEFVYLAPYRNLAVKIVLTRLGRQEVLDEYNKETIRMFIDN